MKKKKTEAPENPRLGNTLARISKEMGKGVFPEKLFEFTRPKIDALEIRNSLKMSRQEFGMAFGLSIRTLQNWEEHRRTPEGPAKSYLIAIKYASRSVAEALDQYRTVEQHLASKADRQSGRDLAQSNTATQERHVLNNYTAPRGLKAR